jgi:hypothetical protein
MPLLQPEQERVTVTLTPLGPQVAMNVTPEQVHGGWERVLALLCEALKVACQERAKELTQQAQRVVVPQIVLPGTGERH